jgi:hypothetical protein
VWLVSWWDIRQRQELILIVSGIMKRKYEQQATDKSAVGGY